jgi:hypothetical protein
LAGPIERLKAGFTALLAESESNPGLRNPKFDNEATNNDSASHTATLKATFSLLGTDKVTGYASMKVQVDTLL